MFPLQPKELDPSAVLPLDCLLAFVFFDANWCGYLHRRDLERILLTLGLRLSAEQVPCLAPPWSFLGASPVVLCTGMHLVPVGDSEDALVLGSSTSGGEGLHLLIRGILGVCLL